MMRWLAFLRIASPVMGMTSRPAEYCSPLPLFAVLVICMYQVADIAARVTITLICAITAAEGDVGQGLI